MNILLHKEDLPHDLNLEGSIAIDTETMGLNPHRDRLCLVQLTNGNNDIHLVQISKGQKSAPHLQKLLENTEQTKIFHYARFDVAVLKQYLNIDVSPVFCTKIASKLSRTYTDRHGLKDVCKELLNVDLSKQQQSSNWGIETLSDEQLHYAASDVLYLHDLMDKLTLMLEQVDRKDIAKRCFDFLKTRGELDLMGWGESDIFAHK